METKIRNATLSDIPSILVFAKQVGRFISADEVRTWLQVDSEAMFVAETIPGGKLIGSCCGTRLTPELGFMGFYVVLEEYRRKGIGSKLWKAAKAHLGDRNIGVRGDPINFRKYSEQDGFAHVLDYSIIYYECYSYSLPEHVIMSSNIDVTTYFEGNLISVSNKLSNSYSLFVDKIPHKEARKTENDSDISDSKLQWEIQKDVEYSENLSSARLPLSAGKSPGPECIRESVSKSASFKDISVQSAHVGLLSSKNENKQDIGMTEDELSFISVIPNASKSTVGEDILAKVVSFDMLLHNRDRSFLVNQTFLWPSCRSKVALMEDKVVGYACLRSVVTEHWIISPFYADSEVIAETLLIELLKEFDFSKAPKGIQIRFPDKNIKCKGLVEKFGFRVVPIRILTGFTKQCVNVDTSKVYSFHSTVFCSE